MALKVGEVLEVEAADGVAVLTLNRPAQRNALSRELMLEVVAALEGVREDAEVRVVVIAGVEVARSVGRKRAFELLLTGTPIDAETAADWGLVNRVVAPVDLETATNELAGAIAAVSPLTVATGKRAFYAQIDLGLGAAYEHCQGVMSENATAADAQEGMSAFVEKRTPTWRGR